MTKLSRGTLQFFAIMVTVVVLYYTLESCGVIAPVYSGYKKKNNVEMYKKKLSEHYKKKKAEMYRKKEMYKKGGMHKKKEGYCSSCAR